MNTHTLPTQRTSLGDWRARALGLIVRAVPDDLIALASRFGVGSIFFLSGRTKVDGGLTVSDTALLLFEQDYALPLIPPVWAAHLATGRGPVRFKWERHGEFSSYTFFTAGLSGLPFAEPVVALLPAGWLAGVPGQTVFAAHAKLAPASLLVDAAQGPGGTPSAGQLAAHFGGNVVVGAGIGDGAGMAFTDFVIHPDGFARFLLLDREMTERQAGRMLQRLFEIEAYRMMALLALPVARGLWPRRQASERTLAGLTERIAAGANAGPGQDEQLLQDLMALAAEIESVV